MSKKELPNAPRPTGAGLVTKEYWVRDRILPGKPIKIWGEKLTYDEAWKLKELIAANRQSTTVRVEKMHAGAPVQTYGNALPPAPAPEQLTWDDRQRIAVANEAARVAAAHSNVNAAGVQATPNAPAPAAVVSSEDLLINQLAEDQAADLADVLGDGDEEEDEDEIDALLKEDAAVAEANAAADAKAETKRDAKLDAKPDSKPAKSGKHDSKR